ncbi:DUF1294 domain-containing protein [uncultured Sulfitobacter sp.]|uniref:DUF1294 domain-containing protein n=1 Tax=uncultured Sulfitobacter sp. TaxID=191468 RepID=UPI00345300CF
MIFLITIFVYFVGVNIFAYRAFAIDKRKAINNDRRTSEKTLLFWASIGGWIGAKIAQHRLRHKTHKQPFGSELNFIGMLQVACMVLFIGVFTALAFVPTGANFRRPAQTASPVPQVVQPVDGQLLISLRPPAARPATW